MYLYLMYVPLGPQHSALIINLHAAAVFSPEYLWCTGRDGTKQVTVQTQSIDAPQV